MDLRTIRSVAHAIVVVLLASACGGERSGSVCTGSDIQLRQSGTLTVAADLSYPPFAYRNAKGDPVGFEVELLRIVARELKVKATFINRGSAALLPGLLTHRYDIAASGFRDTGELRGVACLSRPYLAADLAMLALSPPLHEVRGIGDLEGRNVGVLKHGRGASWARTNLPRSKIVTLPAPDDLLESLRSGRLDAVIDELAFARFAATRSAAFRVATRIETAEKYVFATAPDNGAMMAKIDQTLVRLRTARRLGRLELKWFGP